MARKRHKIKDVRYPIGDEAQMTGLGMLRDGTLIAGVVINLIKKEKQKIEKVSTQCYWAA